MTVAAFEERSAQPPAQPLQPRIDLLLIAGMVEPGEYFCGSPKWPSSHSRVRRSATPFSTGPAAVGAGVIVDGEAATPAGSATVTPLGTSPARIATAGIWITLPASPHSSVITVVV